MNGQVRCKNIKRLHYTFLKKRCGNRKESSVKKMNNIKVSNFPPCKDNLKEHVKHANFSAGVVHNASVRHPELPLPQDGHGWVCSDGVLEPKWLSGPVLPEQLADILEETEVDSEDDSEDNTDEDEDVNFKTDSDESDDE